MNWGKARKASGLLFVAVIFLQVPAFAKITLGSDSIRYYKDALRGISVNYQDTGAICEQVARVELGQVYPASRYYIDTGILIGEQRPGSDSGPWGNPLGEIDVAVFDAFTHRAVEIVEMKCWSGNQQSAFNKASRQRDRFFHNISFGNVQLRSRRRGYTVDQFRWMPASQYRIGGPKGTGGYGFNFQLSLTFDQLMALRDEMIACQRQGDCAGAP